MRRAITVISFTLYGASLLIFISALLSPLRRESTPREVSNTEAYASPESLEQPIEKPAQEQTQSYEATSKGEPSITQVEGKVEQNDNVIDASREDSRTMPSLQAAPEAPIPPRDEKPPESVNSIAAEEKPSSQRRPMTLLVLGDGSFSPGVAIPQASAQEAIDKIIPLIQAQPLDKVIIEGHADKSIPDGFTPMQASKWNKIVSMLRAQSIAQLLKKKGVAGDRITFKGLGDAVPLASNRTKAGRSKNRRVEIKLSPPRQK
ncbi:OmpA family protein [Methylomicrobium lacus]|uniref:OmpA family protein n=1 Tax=Methylomicrobium lacus TaxID=136992 RepID=UPI0035A93B64